MEAKLVDRLPDEEGWQFEPKWDGFRALVFRAGTHVELRAKSGKPLTRYFPEVVEAVRAAAIDRFVVDGELAIPVGGSLSFSALQMRLHPAESRIRKLSVETPAVLILFDCLMAPHEGSLLEAPLVERRAALEGLYRTLADIPTFRLTPYTRDCRKAKRWLERTGGELDGVVAKRFHDAYKPGERAMLKVKHLRTAECVVGGFRYEQGSRRVGSLLLGLYNHEGRLDHVGFTSTLPHAERAALTARLERLAGPPGFTGNAPGGPSRWSTERSAEWTPLKPKLVVEVRYDHITDGRFRHGTTLVRWRPDKAPAQCTVEQIERPAAPDRLIAAVEARPPRQEGSTLRRPLPAKRRAARPASERPVTRRRAARRA